MKRREKDKILTFTRENFSENISEIEYITKIVPAPAVPKYNKKIKKIKNILTQALEKFYNEDENSEIKRELNKRMNKNFYNPDENLINNYRNIEEENYIDIYELSIRERKLLKDIPIEKYLGKEFISHLTMENLLYIIKSPFIIITEMISRVIYNNLEVFNLESMNCKEKIENIINTNPLSKVMGEKNYFEIMWNEVDYNLKIYAAEILIDQNSYLSGPVKTQILLYTKTIIETYYEICKNFIEKIFYEDDNITVILDYDKNKLNLYLDSLLLAIEEINVETGLGKFSINEKTKKYMPLKFVIKGKEISIDEYMIKVQKTASYKAKQFLNEIEMTKAKEDTVYFSAEMKKKIKSKEIQKNHTKNKPKTRFKGQIKWLQNPEINVNKKVMSNEEIKEEVLSEFKIERSPKKLDKIAKKRGYVIAGCKGSHKKYKNETCSVIIPQHSELGKGLGAKIQKQLVKGTINNNNK